MNELIKRELDDYIEFDSVLLFEPTDYLVVFGGAIRDIIADKSNRQITDIDILCLSESRDKCIDVVVSNGYKRMDLQRPELHEMYKDVHHIFEPLTFLKGDKIIQFITPSVIEMPRPYHERNLRIAMAQSFFYLLSNVDLMTSGVFYDGYHVYESIKGSIGYIVNKLSIRIPTNRMYGEKRITHRIYKLENKGFKEIWDARASDDVINQRRLKLYTLQNKHLQIEDFKKFIGFHDDIKIEMKKNVNTIIDDLDF